MTQDEISMKKIEFERETKQIKGEFSRLLLRLQKSLEESCKVDDVVNLLINLDDEDMLKRCKSIADVFKKASKFCSFYETKAVKILIEELGTDQDRENYEKYKRVFQSFCLKRVILFPDGKSSKDLVMETDKHIEKLPEEQQKQLQYEISRVFKGKKPVKLLSNEQLKPSQAVVNSSETGQVANVSHNIDDVTNSKAITPTRTVGITTSSEASSFTTPTKSASISTLSEAPSFTKSASITTSSETASFTTPSKVASITTSSETPSFTTPSKAVSTSEAFNFVMQRKITSKRNNTATSSSISSYTEVSKNIHRCTNTKGNCSDNECMDSKGAEKLSMHE